MLGVKIHYKPKFDKKPILIAALPDMGNVAGLCLNFLINKIDTKIFAEIYSFWPPSVTYKKGIINYLLINNLPGYFLLLHPKYSPADEWLCGWLPLATNPAA